MSQVGFTFQGDVFTGGSLVFNTTGRLLKALSDGNVDVLAVAASLQLGKSIPITRTQEAIVARSMEKRSVTKSGFLAKALSVGWGHSDVAYELSRTQAGCATLLLINALSAGISSFKAAEGLQELLIHHGCLPEVLPTVDSLNTVVKYVAPIMIDSGFHAIMENTHIAITVEMKKKFRLTEFEKWQPIVMQDSVDIKQWVDSVRQLCWTASREESLYIRIDGRISWLATFAVHILGTGCKVVCGATTLWETPGSKGILTLQFGPNDASSTTETLAGALSFSLEPTDDTGVLHKVRGRYLLKDAIRSEIEKSGTTTPGFYGIFCPCFVRYFVLSFVTISWGNHHSIISNDQRLKAIERVLGYLGIELDAQIEAAIWEVLSISHDLSHSNKKEEYLGHIQYSIDILGDARYFAVDLIQTVTPFALSLVSCDISVNNISVPTLQLDYKIDFLGLRNPGFSSPSPTSLTTMEHSMLSHTDMWVTLCDFCFGRTNDRMNNSRSVVMSADGITLSMRMLFEDEAFTRDGKIFAIYPGQLAYAGIKRREAVVRPRVPNNISPKYDGWTLLPGTTFKHPYIPASILDIKTTVEVRESLEITIKIVLEDEKSSCFSYVFDAFVALSTLTMSGALANSCSHPVKDSFSVPLESRSDEKPLGFLVGILTRSRISSSDCTFLCLQGTSRFHQLVSIILTRDLCFGSSMNFMLQEDACLSCAVENGRWMCGGDELLSRYALVIICNHPVPNNPQDAIRAS